MTIADLMKRLVEYDPQIKVEVSIEGEFFPIKFLWTKGGDDPHTLVLAVDTELRVAILTRQEYEELDERRGREEPEATPDA